MPEHSQYCGRLNQVPINLFSPNHLLLCRVLPSLTELLSRRRNRRAQLPSLDLQSAWLPILTTVSSSLHQGEPCVNFAQFCSMTLSNRMSSADSCGCTWQPAGQQPAAIPASQLSVPMLAPQSVHVRVSAGALNFIHVFMRSVHIIQVEFAQAIVSWNHFSKLLPNFPMTLSSEFI